MTRSERLKAFTMRLDGAPWEQIGNELGYAGNTVRRDLYGCMEPRGTSHCAYPAIRTYILSKCDGSVSDFAAVCGLSVSSMYRILGEQARPSFVAAQSIAKVVGMDIDAVFAKEEEDVSL